MASKPDPFRPHVELPSVPQKAGCGNAQFLADIARGQTAEQMRANWKQGAYPGLNEKWARENLAFWGKA